MSDLTNKYTQYSIYKMFVDALEEDGVICNYYNTDYDENETYKGGTNSRLAFTNYNNKIIKYHAILKVLTGEQRANITEQIPAIDMFDLSNSSLLYTYPISGNKIDASTIIAIEPAAGRSSLQLIEDEYPAIINRAIMGDPLAEHFYNTAGLVSSEYNIQVSPWNGKYAFLYKGIWTDPVILNNEIVTGTRKTSFLVYSVGGSTKIPFVPLSIDPELSYGKIKQINDNNYYVLNKDEDTIVLNTDCGFTPSSGEVVSPIYFEENNIITPPTKSNIDLSSTFSSEESKINNITIDSNQYFLNLESGDYVVALPTTTYSSGCNRLLIFKASSREGSSSHTVTETAESGWLNPDDGKFYKDRNFSDPILPNVSSYYLDELDKGISNEYSYYKYDRGIKAYEKVISAVRDESDSTGKKIKVTIADSHYQSYILYINNFTSGISDSSAFEEVTIDTNLLDYFPNDDNVIDILSRYISISKEYYSEASGLLDGYYCEPLEWTSSAGSNDRIITKWKFSDDYNLARLKNVNIDIGSKYFPGHLLDRGNILSSPLQLTSNDFLVKDLDGISTTYYAAISGKTPTLESIGINGKASLIYETLRDPNLISSLFNSSKVSNWGGFSTRKLGSVLTKFDYSKDKYSSSVIKNLTGGDSSDIRKPMEYADKFYVDNQLIGMDRILEYINRFRNCIQGDTLVLSSRDSFTKVSYSTSVDTVDGKGNKEGVAQTSSDSQINGNIERLKSDFDTSFVVSYNVHYTASGGYDNNFESPRVSVVTPRELFTRQGELPNPDSSIYGSDTILVFPEYNKYFPESAILLSQYDLGLEEYSYDDNNPTKGICSFLNTKTGGEDHVLMFSVASKMVLKFSDIRKIQLSDEINNYSPRTTVVNDCCLGPGVYLCGRKDYTGSGKSDDKDESKSSQDRDRFEGFKTLRDCYIYVLSSLPVSLENKVKIYDDNDKEINISDYETESRILAASYPDNSYFPVKVTRSTDGGVRYEILQDSISRSFEILKGSNVIPGLPKFSDSEELRYKSYGNYTLTAIANFLKTDNISSIIRRTLGNIITRWPLSSYEKNPLVIGNILELLDGLVDFKNSIRDFAESEYEIVKAGSLQKVLESDILNFINRISKDDIYYEKRYKFSQGDFTPITDSDLSKFPEVLRDRLHYTLNGIKSEIIELKDNPKERPSLTKLADIVRPLFVGDLNFDRDECKILDECFGNNTRAFLDIGDISDTEERENYRSTALSECIEEYHKMVRDTIVITANEFLGNKFISIREESLNSLKADLSNIYTAQSINNAVKISDSGVSKGNLDIDESLLVVNYSAPITRKLLEQIKAATEVSKPPKYTTSWLYENKVRWSKMSLNKFISTYLSESALFNPTQEVVSGRSYILSRLSALIPPYVQNYVSIYNSEVDITAKITEDDVENYLIGSGDVNIAPDNIRVVPSANNKYTFIVGLPALTLSEDNKTANLSSLAGEPLSNYLARKEHPDNMREVWSWTRDKRLVEDPDVSVTVLKGLADYAKQALEGIPLNNASDSKDSPFVKYVGGVDDTIIGRKDSLYYKRYQMLNNRMNRIQGPLWQAASYLRNGEVFGDIKKFSGQVVDSYDKFMNVIPIASIEPLTYMPEQMATLSTIPLAGKFYSDAELEAMKSSINSKCVLTCTSCSVRDTCPFFNENEVIKMYCTGIETIDLWVKDNELDLLDDIRMRSPEGEGFSLDKYKSYHLPYSDVVKKIDSDEKVETYEVNDLNALREHLRDAESIEYSNNVKDDMGWLNHGRYGTIERNSIKDILEDDPSNEFYPFRDKIHPYKYMYDALFIDMDEDENNNSYIRYESSYNRYPVSLEMGKPGEKKHFVGSTRVKIPVSLKIIDNADDEDDVYLVSDDTKDADGLEIMPVIYLGKAKNIQWTFDLVDDGVGAEKVVSKNDSYIGETENRGSMTSQDPKLYAADVAQWCINYYKGNCVDDPIGNVSDNIIDNFNNRDQYWMEKVYKKIVDPESGETKWYEYPGRKRVNSGYSEPLIEESSFDDILAVSGRPMVANYINFVRKVSIRMYNNDEPDERLRWTIPWVNPDLPSLSKDLFSGSNIETQLEILRERQRSILPLMKTNLRLVVVKSGKK